MNPRLPNATLSIDDKVKLYYGHKYKNYFESDYGFGYFEEFPGNCAIIIIHDVKIFSEEAEKNIKLFKTIIEYAKYNNYTKIIYTTTTDQTHIIRVLEELKFVLHDTFVSRRTKNTIQTWEYYISEEKDDDD